MDKEVVVVTKPMLVRNYQGNRPIPLSVVPRSRGAVTVARVATFAVSVLASGCILHRFTFVSGLLQTPVLRPQIVPFVATGADKPCAFLTDAVLYCI